MVDFQDHSKKSYNSTKKISNHLFYKWSKDMNRYFHKTYILKVNRIIKCAYWHLQFKLKQ